MSHEEFDRILEHTLEDYRLSRGEKRVVKSVLGALDASEQELGVLRSRAFALAEEQLLDPDSKALLAWLEDVVNVLQPQAAPAPLPDEVFFSPGDACPRKIVNLIEGCRSQVDICVFTITDDRISDAIHNTHRRNVPVRIITDNDKQHDAGSDIRYLHGAGVPVRFDRTENHMHHKFAIFDRRRALTGSYNWTRSAANFNEENFLVSADPEVVRTFGEKFERLWEELG